MDCPSKRTSHRLHLKNDGTYESANRFTPAGAGAAAAASPPTVTASLLATGAVVAVLDAQDAGAEGAMPKSAAVSTFLEESGTV